MLKLSNVFLLEFPILGGEEELNSCVLVYLLRIARIESLPDVFLLDKFHFIFLGQGNVRQSFC